MRLLGPVFFKELFQLAQSRRLTLMKGFFLSVLLFGFFMIAAETRRYNQDEFGVMIYVGLCFLNAGAILLFAPVFTASAVSGEREANTLRLLFLTRLSAWNIVQDKGLSRMALLLFIVSLTFPIMASTVLYGGIETRHIVCAIGNIGALALLTSGCSILFSTLRSRFSSALASSYLTLLVYLLFLPLIVGIYFRSPYPTAWFSPFMSVGFSFEGAFGGVAGYSDRTWQSNLIIALVIYVVCTTTSAILVRRMALNDQVQASPYSKGFKAAFMRTGYVISLMNPFFSLRGQFLLNQNPISWQYGRIAPHSSRHGIYSMANALVFVFSGVLLVSCWYAWRYDSMSVRMGQFYGLVCFSFLSIMILLATTRYGIMSGRSKLGAFPWVMIGFMVVGSLFVVWLLDTRLPSWKSFPYGVGPFMHPHLWYALLFASALIAMVIALIRYKRYDPENIETSVTFRFWSSTAGWLSLAMYACGTTWCLKQLRMDDDDFIFSSYFITFLVGIVMTVLLSASTFSRERQTDTLPVLMSTCLSGRRVVYGVILGLVRTLLPVYGVCLMLLLMGYVLLGSDDIGLFTSMVQLVVQIFFTMMLTLLISLKRTNPAQTIMISFAILLTLYIVIPLFGAIADTELYKMSPGYLAAIGLDEDLDHEHGVWWFNTLVLYLSTALIMFQVLRVNFNHATGRQEEY